MRVSVAAPLGSRHAPVEARSIPRSCGRPAASAGIQERRSAGAGSLWLVAQFRAPPKGHSQKWLPTGPDPIEWTTRPTPIRIGHGESSPRLRSRKCIGHIAHQTSQNTYELATVPGRPLDPTGERRRAVRPPPSPVRPRGGRSRGPNRPWGESVQLSSGARTVGQTFRKHPPEPDS